MSFQPGQTISVKGYLSWIFFFFKPSITLWRPLVAQFLHCDTFSFLLSTHSKTTVVHILIKNLPHSSLNVLKVYCSHCHLCLTSKMMTHFDIQPIYFYIACMHVHSLWLLCENSSELAVPFPLPKHSIASGRLLISPSVAVWCPEIADNRKSQPAICV